jgi:cysteine desulfurase / selenocysteine lyase
MRPAADPTPSPTVAEYRPARFSPVEARTGAVRFDVERIREDFPILSRRVRGMPLVYLDNAATSQKPQSVIDAVADFYRLDNANIHRGIHYLSERATADYQAVRRQVARFLNAASDREIVFTRGTTEGINLVAQSFGREFLRPGDEVLITGMEHHSNIVPWQLIAEQTGAALKAVPLTTTGELDLESFERLLGPKTRLVAVVHVSNALGTINPVKRLIAMAHQQDVPVLLDGAQSVPHFPVDVQDLECDFLAFSGHKLYGPTGVGVLYGRESLLERMPPCQGGGGMIESVTVERSTWADLPAKFEAGTPMIAEVRGLGAALDYVSRIGWVAIELWEQSLLAYATQELAALDGVTIIGTAPAKASVVSFTMDQIHPHDISAILDEGGVAIRAGHHCAQPVMRHFGIPGTARASFALYNTREEVDALVAGLVRVREVFG